MKELTALTDTDGSESLALNISEAAAGKRYLRALERIKKVLSDQLDDPEAL